MRRLLAIPLLSALIAVGGLAVAAGASTASSASPATICPADGPPGVCCGPPLIIPASGSIVPCCLISCCPGSAACVVPMSITSKPNPSIAGAAVTVSGQIQGATAGTAVTLWQELPGQNSFQQIAQTTTTSSGAYKLRQGGSAVQTDRSWYVASGGAKSLTIEQVVKAKLTVSVKRHKVSGGEKVTLSGKVDPAHGGQRVVLQEKVGGVWRALAHVRLNQKSRYSVSHRWAKAGVVKLRVALGADRRNAASVSSVLSVKLPA